MAAIAIDIVSLWSYIISTFRLGSGKRLRISVGSSLTLVHIALDSKCTEFTAFAQSELQEYRGDAQFRAR